MLSICEHFYSMDIGSTIQCTKWKEKSWISNSSCLQDIGAKRSGTYTR